ncbi:hypothetical protein CF326_g7608, partial [Tilletia indica]
MPPRGSNRGKGKAVPTQRSILLPKEANKAAHSNTSDSPAAATGAAVPSTEVTEANTAVDDEVELGETGKKVSTN